jgi:hypothetical protein
LKVFRTPIGFHDAYVAAPSMKAALKAWGADSNLFAQGIAEAVTDPRLMKEALASPGEVIRRPRGSAGEHLQAVGKAKVPSPRSPSKSRPASGSRPYPRRSDPEARGSRERGEKPDRGALDRAEQALAELDRAHRSEMRGIDRAQAELERRRRQAERAYAVDREEAAVRRDKARRAYDRAMKAWRG